MSLSLNQKEQLLRSQRASASKPTLNKIHQESHVPGGGDPGSPPPPVGVMASLIRTGSNTTTGLACLDHEPDPPLNVPLSVIISLDTDRQPPRNLQAGIWR